MKSIDTHLFIEIILSEGASHLYSSNNHDTDIAFYSGPSGTKVLICIEDEEIDCETCKIYLHQLGFVNLIPRLFPKKNVTAE
jgi:hypothetical protein